MDRWRGRLHYARFLAGKHWKLVLAPVALLAGAAALWRGGFAGPAGALGSASVLAAALLLGADLRHAWAVWHQWYAQPYPPRVHRDCKTSALYDGYRMLEVGDDLVLYSPAVNARLQRASNPLAILDGSFAVPRAAARYQEFALRHFGRGKILFDAPKVRLVSDLTPESLAAGSPVTVQRTTYFAGVATNELAGINVKSRPDAAVVFEGRGLVCRDGLLSDLADSDCSNHVGVSTLAFTRDGNFPVMPQSVASAQSPGLDAPSGSGSLDFPEPGAAGTLQDLLRAGMTRELFEEALGRQPAEGADTLLLGYVRHFRRGGKPEFFGVTRLDHRRTELFVRRGERQYHHGIDLVKVDLRSVGSVCEGLRALRTGDRALSTHLYVNLLFLEEHLERRGEPAVRWLRGE